MQQTLKQLGLEDTEAKVYLALLELGPSTVTEITKKAQVTRTLGYHVLQKLGWQGLVNESSGSGKKKVYAAEHPQSFLRFVKNKKRSWERREEDAEKILPDLVALYQTQDKPVIRYQHGVNGVMSLFEESLQSKTEILSILDVESWKTSDFWEWAKKYNRERNKQRIKERILLLDTPAAREWVSQYKTSPVYTLYHWVKPEEVQGLLQFGGEINVYENKVMIALLKAPHILGVIMESPVLSNILKGMFEFIWNKTEKVVFHKQKSH